MGKIAEKAKFIDMYASLPALSFGKDGKVYSRFGFLLTLLTIIIIGGMAIFVGIRIFGRQTPSFIQYQLPPSELNPQIPWNTDDFKFGLGLLALAGMENDYVSYTATYTDVYTSTNIPVTSNECQFKIVEGASLNCFEQDKSTKGKTFLDAKGGWTFKIQYDYCTDTSKYNCETQADVNAVLKDYSVAAYFVYQDLLVDPFNYENPLTAIESFTDERVLLDVGTTLLVELNEIEFTSDNGWIFEDLKTEIRFKPTTSIKVSDANMLGVKIIYGGNKTVYKRTYPKLQDFFAQISGFITIITPIFLILVSPYGNLQAVQHMVNEIYEIKLNKPNNNGNGNRDDSPQKPLAKKKRNPSKSFSSSHKLSRKVASKSPQNKAPIHSKNIRIAKEEIPPTPKDDSAAPLNPITFDQMPPSPQSTLISPQKILTGLAKASAPEELQIEDLEAQQEEVIEDQNPDEEEGGVSDCDTDVPLRTSDLLEVPWQAWLKSFWKPNPKVQVLNKAKDHLMDAFDLVTLAKKVIEIDKLKACLFTYEQRVIFENLPSSVIVLNPDVDLKSPEAIKQYHWKDSCKGDKVALKKAYSRLKETKGELDQLLIRLYENEFIDDGASL